MDALWCYTDCTAVYNGVKKRLSDHASRIEGPQKNGRGREVQTIWHNTRGTVARLNPIVRTTKGRLHAGLLSLPWCIRCRDQNRQHGKPI